jgi:hypothetical protein
VVYGPNINAAAILLSSEGNVPVERAAASMEALLGTPVSSGFAARALARLAGRLAAAGFDAAMKDAPQAEDVLCGDETPANVITKDTDKHGETVPGAPHAVTRRALLPRHQPQPRHPAHRRHPRRPHRTPLATDSGQHLTPAPESTHLARSS